MLLVRGTQESLLPSFQRKLSRRNRAEFKMSILGGDHPYGLIAIFGVGQRNASKAKRRAVQRAHNGAGNFVGCCGCRTRRHEHVLRANHRMRKNQRQRECLHNHSNPRPAGYRHSHSFSAINCNRRCSVWPATTLITCDFDAYRSANSSLVNSSSDRWRSKASTR